MEAEQIKEYISLIDEKVKFISHIRSLHEKYEEDWQEASFFSADADENSYRARGLSDLCDAYQVVLDNEIRILNNLKGRIRGPAVKAAMGKHSVFEGFFLHWCNVSTDWLKKEAKYFQEVGNIFDTEAIALKKEVIGNVYEQESFPKPKGYQFKPLI